MNRLCRVWYLLAFVVALAPAGARLVWWQRTARPAAVEPEMAAAGKVLFEHEWQVNDPLCNGGDGLGPVFNASSCVACHNQGGPGGGGGLKHNVTTFSVRLPGQPHRDGVVHAFHVRGDRYAETLRHVHPDMPTVARPELEQVVALPGREGHCLPTPPVVAISQRNTPALFGCRLIDAIPERVILAAARSQRLKWGKSADDENLPVGRPHRLSNGRVGRFGWKAQTASLSDFVRAACANELGLGNPGQSQPTPLYDGMASLPAKLDLTVKQCDELTAFCASLPRPVERLPKDVSAEQAASGKQLFGKIGCAECHTPNLGSVEGIYGDLLLHRMGPDLVGGGSYGEPPPPASQGGASPGEWRTPPLWGVADSAPYLHDGRAATLADAILLHGGQAKRSVLQFRALSQPEQGYLIAFLKTLRAP